MSTVHHYKAQLEALTATEAGTFTALASTTATDWDNERFAPSAWDATVAQWQSYQDAPPLLWNHQWNDPASVLGWITSMQATASGLVVEGRLDLSNPKSEEVYRAMRSGALDSLSVGFNYRETHEEGDVRVIDRADLIEISVTPIPANPNARILEVKSKRSTQRCERCTSLERCAKHRPFVSPDVLEYKARISALTGQSAPSEGSGLVDQFVAAERTRKAAEAAEQERLRAHAEWVDNLPRRTWEETFEVEAEREADARARDLERLEQRDLERRQELEQAQAEREALRQSGFGDVVYPEQV